MSFWVSFFYWGAFSMLAVSAAAGHRVMQANPMHRPVNPIVVDQVSAFAGWLALAAAGFGLWQDGWFALALLAFCLAVVVPLELRRLYQNFDRAPSRVAMLGIGGTLLQISMISYVLLTD